MTDLIGQRFGNLTVIGLHHTIQRYRNGKKSGLFHYYDCLCDCGNHTVVLDENLKDGNTKSCGCYRKTFKVKPKQPKIDTRIKHGKTHTRLFGIWMSMRNRCLNPQCKDYKNYGGRGIIVCPEWLEDFMSFYDWAINNGYDEDLSIDRVNTNGNYCPENCRWADRYMQQNNRRCCKYASYNGETHTLREWSRITGINHCTLSARINKYGWDVELAFTTKPHQNKRRKKDAE